MILAWMNIGVVHLSQIETSVIKNVLIIINNSLQVTFNNQEVYELRWYNSFQFYIEPNKIYVSI